MRTLFEISRSGMLSAERSLSVTANNVVNAETPGYTRQRVSNTPAGQQMGGFHAGLGVSISQIDRIRNELNDQLLSEKRQDFGYLNAKSRLFEQMEAAMTSDSGGDLDLRLGRFFDAFSDLSSDPQDMSIREGLVSEAIQLADKMADMSRSLDQISESALESALHSTDRVNALLRDLSDLNRSIRQGEARGSGDFTSLDIQVQRLEELYDLTNFEYRKTDTGALEIRIGGVLVLDENRAHTIRPEVDEPESEFRLRLDNGKQISVTGGAIGAQIEMYRSEIPDQKERLDELASTLVTEFNALHRQGFGLDDATPRDFFDPEGLTAASIRVDDAIRDNHRHIAASSVAGEAGNGDVAAQLAGLRNQQLPGGRKMVDHAVHLISAPGSQVSDIRSRMEARDSEIQMLTVQQERESGVNIDEELSLMIRHQNAYQGAARMMGAAQNMVDTLLTLIR